MWKPLPNKSVLKSLRLTAIHNGPKQRISTSGGFELLQIVLELDTGQCAREEAGSPREVDCEIPHRLRRGTKHSLQGCGNLSLINAF